MVANIGISVDSYIAKRVSLIQILVEFKFDTGSDAGMVSFEIDQADFLGIQHLLCITVLEPPSFNYGTTNTLVVLTT